MTDPYKPPTDPTGNPFPPNPNGPPQPAVDAPKGTPKGETVIVDGKTMTHVEYAEYRRGHKEA